MSKCIFVYLGTLIHDVSSHIRPVMFDGMERAEPMRHVGLRAEDGGGGGLEDQDKGAALKAMLLQSELWWTSLTVSAMVASVRRHMHRIPLDTAKRAADFFAAPNAILLLDAFAKCVCAASVDTWIVTPSSSSSPPCARRVEETTTTTTAKMMGHGDAGIDLLATTAAQTNRSLCVCVCVCVCVCACVCVFLVSWTFFRFSLPLVAA
jgi:hypothetical protein